jgi:hypothetical protein
MEALYFVDEPNYDYQLQSNAPAIDAGVAQFPVNSYSLSPDFAYVHPLAMAPRAIVNGGIDVGAYEYDIISSTLHPVATEALIYPNPTKGELTIELGVVDQLELYNHLGQLQLFAAQKNKINLSDLPEGIYFLKIESNRDLFFATVILQK